MIQCLTYYLGVQLRLLRLNTLHDDLKNCHLGQDQHKHTHTHTHTHTHNHHAHKQAERNINETVYWKNYGNRINSPLHNNSLRVTAIYIYGYKFKMVFLTELMTLYKIAEIHFILV